MPGTWAFQSAVTSKALLLSSLDLEYTLHGILKLALKAARQVPQPLG